MVLRDDILPESLTQEQSVVVERIMDNFANNVLEPSTRYPNDGKRLRQPKPAQDIDGFTDLVLRVIQEQQNLDEVPLANRVKFIQDFSPDDLETEIITFGLLRRMPSSMSQGQHYNQKVREVKPRIRGIDDDPTRPGYKIVTMGQKFENEILLTCWAKTNKQANKRARWLEDTLRNWTWYIRYEGVEDFYFLGQDEDLALKIDSTNNVLMGRPMRYYVRTERLSHVLEPTIHKIVVKYGLGQSLSETEQ